MASLLTVGDTFTLTIGEDKVKYTILETPDTKILRATREDGRSYCVVSMSWEVWVDLRNLWWHQGR